MPIPHRKAYIMFHNEDVEKQNNNVQGTTRNHPVFNVNEAAANTLGMGYEGS